MSLKPLNMASTTKASIRLQSRTFTFIPIASPRFYSSQTSSRQASYAANHASSSSSSEHLPLSQPSTISKHSPTMPRPPLSVLPLSSIIRSLIVTSISSSPILLPPSLAITSKLAHAKSPILSPDKNPLLRFILKHSFYKQFCAGENAAEVRQTVDGLKSLGFKGVILGYAKEVVMDENEAGSLQSSGDSEAAKASSLSEITSWAEGTIQTVKLAGPDDFVALKFTGAGSQALYALSQNADPSPDLKKAIDSICDLAAARGIGLLFDAEQQVVQAGIDRWTLDYMRKYNNRTPGKALIYGTYQSYLKATPSILASHLAAARKEGFTLGVKLVRGAYLGSDPRHLIHDTKSDTDDAYNSIASSLAKQSYGPVLKAVAGETTFPPINVVLAGHNLVSVRKIQALRTVQASTSAPQTDLVYAQLQGMADEVSCELVQAAQASEGNTKVDIPKAYKYLVWGTTGECMKYLLRRAQENRDAVQRTRDGRDAMASELVRRVKKGLRFSV